MIRPTGDTSSRAGCIVDGGILKNNGAATVRGSSTKLALLPTDDNIPDTGQIEPDMVSDDERSNVETGEDLGTEKPLVNRSPYAPSRQEVIEHDITHCPFRSWCRKCVMGKSKCNPHLKSPDIEERSVPLVALDYAFMSDKAKKSEGEEEDKEQAKILACRDRTSRCYASFSVPQKGVDPDEYATRRTLKFLEFLGWESVILKTDQESALAAVISSVKSHRGANTQTMSQMSPAYDSKSNGFIERAIQSLEGQIRTMKLALEERIGQKISPTASVMHWLIEYASVILNLFEVGPDGKVPYQRLRGRKLKNRLSEFGEQVLFMPLDALK